MIILDNTLLNNDRAHAVPTDIDKVYKLLTVTQKVFEIYGAPIYLLRLLILILCLQCYKYNNSFSFTIFIFKTINPFP